jgi:hypothetical protein
MKKLFFSLLLLNVSLVHALAQAHPYPELQILYADAEYEKLVAKADKTSLKFPDDPLPLIYLSMGLHSISQTEKAQEEMYANAWKESVNKAGAAIKLDNKKGDGVLKDGYYKDYIVALEIEIYEYFNNELGGWYEHKGLSKAQLDKDVKLRDKMYGELSKASGFASSFVKLAPQMAFYNKYLEGAMKFYSNDKVNATAKWKEASDLILAVKKENDAIKKANAVPKAKQKSYKAKPDTIVGFENWYDAEKKMFVHSALLSANALKVANKLPEQQKIMKIVEELSVGDAVLSAFFIEEKNRLGL